MRSASIALLAVLALSVPGTAIGDDGGADIVGGSATTIEEWPWQVAIASPPAPGRNGFQRQFCGGTLVSPTAVLTAAHCVVDDQSGEFVAPSTLSVITGRTVLSSSAGAEIPATDVIYFVSTPTITPQSVLKPPAGSRLYNDGTSEWDVAVLELASPAPAPAAPIAIASAAERNLWEPGDQAFATGWGDSTGAMTYQDELREVDLQVISDTDCGDGNSYGSAFVPTVMVCAGVPGTGGKDTCQGDSGGPLVVPAGDGSFRLIGDTSFGFGCALPEFPGVYGRVADSALRTPITAAIPLADGNPAPADPDLVAPVTTFTRKPAGRVRNRRATFAWTASEAATFTCRLDRSAFEPCTSPVTRRVKAGSRHSFGVVATDAVGNVEESTAVASWKVAPKRRRR